jgi:hypothetical protein
MDRIDAWCCASEGARTMKRAKVLTKRERKALQPARPQNTAPQSQHIHCIACGRHLDPREFNAPQTARMLRCNHGSRFAACTDCETLAFALIAEHDRTGNEVKMANAWH